MFCQHTLFVVEFRDATRVGGEGREGEEGGGQIELYCTIPTELNLHTLVFAPCYPSSGRLVSSWTLYVPPKWIWRRGDRTSRIITNSVEIAAPLSGRRLSGAFHADDLFT